MKRTVLLIALIVSTLSLFGQENKQIELQLENAKLSDALVQLRDQYGIQLSFNHQFLSQYKVSVDSSFVSSHEALAFLVSGYPIKIVQQGEVYVLIKEEPSAPEYILNVQVSDKIDGESLPFSNVLVNNSSLTTNYQGRFSAKSSDSEVFELRISYMGYYILDTTLYAGNHSIKMQPATFNLKEIVIEGVAIDYFSITGSDAGSLRLNKVTASYLPGNGDNSIFNLLRLQPGILASGEQTGDMIIWGSYQGQSKFDYDGYTLFGLKNFKENISTVNPFTVKDIQVHKAGYGAELEGRVGGIVKLSSTDGRKDKSELKFNLNNQTANGLISFPILKSTVVTLAYRKAYTPLFSDDEVTIENNNSGNQRNRLRTDFTLVPQYDYQDFNLKFAGDVRADNFYVSLYKGLDTFGYSLDNNVGQNSIKLLSEEENNQQAGSFFYNKTWGSGGQTSLLISGSELSGSKNDEQEIRQRNNDQSVFELNQELLSTVKENKVQVSHQGYWSTSNSWKSGVQYVGNKTIFSENSSREGISSDNEELNRIGHFVETETGATDWKLRLGARSDYLAEPDKVFFQPRIGVTYGQIEKVRLSLSWGKYNQFLSNNTIIDERGNVIYVWNVADGLTIPVLESKHTVVGLSGSSNGFNWRAEYFNKNTVGLSRTIRTNQIEGTFEGKSKSNGLDLFLSKELNRHYFWVSYTLSSTKELFEYFPTQEYRRALHDQKHEIKAVAMIDLDPFFFSANYVFGSGFPDPRPFQVSDQEETNYSRFDISARAKIRAENPYMEAGLSILNLFNTKNIKYNNFLRIPQGALANINIHTEALPFTPTLYFKIIF